ncbi:ommochrome-binding protein-like [Epargyreus clarus]|uniref:ommochrome-binding protein-like n=1 Tax=Epargyreus clarus TaxID=520877 RepID=UPI003C2ABE27
MKPLIIFPLLFLLTSADKRCRGIYFDDKYYSVNIIKDGVNRLHNLLYNRNDNRVYFTFDQISDRPTRSLAYLNLDTYTATVIDGIRNATSIAIDQATNKIFVGSSDGLFKINDKMIPERLPIQDNIINMHYKDVLYFTNAKREAYIFEDGYATLVQELQGYAVDNLILDNDNNIFFVENKKLFRVKLGTRAVNIHERHIVDAIATDIHSKAYVCSNMGVFVYNKYKYVLDKVAGINKLKALTFNNNNEPIYAVSDLIVKLKYNEVPCFED